ncbi:E3 ubiquitin-protein ligase TRIM56-like isoform X2 [Branchiostoma floridae]|uniref:E3 ubiquitin-protein ligase TRIM56-like isoform X2 n=1 Tax=Branchiostoma floridae TaxID=7739 RepID=A0A9J7LFP1_BRAFL|nr:E3 ubiquitin-protein ligase TRIM56-like isoform X2 [Branchiostoma floridae]
MASGVASQIKEEFLVCQICFEDYDKPKVLPCQHTFCQKCLKEMLAKMGKLTCPNCRLECQLPQNGVEGLPTSFFVNKLRDIIKGSGGVTRARTSPCTCDDKSTTTSCCLDCRKELCAPCSASHRRPTANRRHRVVPKDDASGAAAGHTAPTPAGGHSGQGTNVRQAPVQVLLSSGRHSEIEDFFVRLCSTRYIHPDRVLPILSWLKEQDIMTAQDLHDNWDDVRNMVDMTNAMKQHITEALEEFSKAGH